MKIVLIVFAILILAAGAGVAFFPMSVAADLAASRVSAFRYSGATGSVWKGRLQNVAFGEQAIGDVGVVADPGALLRGQAAARLSVSRPSMQGEAAFRLPLAGGDIRLDDISVQGVMAAIPGLPDDVSRSDGRFTLEIADLVLSDGVCAAATGEAWTDALARLDFDGRWTGPELRGPVSCRDGLITVETGGNAPGGELVIATISINPDLGMTLDSSISGAGPEAAATLARLGFRASNGALVLRRTIGREP